MSKKPTELFENLTDKHKKRVQGGEPTSDLIMSAYVAGNEEVFPEILHLHVPKGSTVADVTWGKGVSGKTSPQKITNFSLRILQWGLIAGFYLTKMNQ